MSEIKRFTLSEPKNYSDLKKQIDDKLDEAFNIACETRKTVKVHVQTFDGEELFTIDIEPDTIKGAD